MLNSSSSELVELSHPANSSSMGGWLASTIIFNLWALIGIPPAVLILVATCRNAELQKPYNLLIASAVSGDGLFLAVFATLQAYFTHPSNLTSTILACEIIGIATFTIPAVPLLTWAIVSVNRYYALYDSSSYARIFTTRKIHLINLVVWGLAVLQATPYHSLLHAAGYESKELRICGVNLDGKAANIGYLIFTATICLAVPTAVTAYCNVKIYRKIAEHRKLLFKSTINSSVACEFDNILRLMTVSCILPAILQFPAATIKLIAAAGEIEWLARLSQALFLFSSATTPYLVILFVRPYRGGLRLLLARNRDAKNTVAPLRVVVSLQNNCQHNIYSTGAVSGPNWNIVDQ